MDKIKAGIERQCPKCKELVQFEAIVCKHCQADFADAHRDEKEKLAILVLSGMSMNDMAKELRVLPQAVPKFLKFHFNEVGISRLKAQLEREGTYNSHPELAARKEAVEKRKKSKRTVFLILGAVAALLIAVSSIQNYFKRQAAEEQDRIQQEADQAAEVARQDSIAKYDKWYSSLSQAQKDSVAKVANEREAAPYIKRIENELDDLEKFTRNNLDVEADDISIATNGALLMAWQKIYHEFNGKKGLTPQLDRKIAEYSRLLPRVLSRQYPVVRAAMVKNWKNKMWEHNIEVIGRGPGTTTVRFIGGTFANNQSKQEFQSKISDDVRLMRFKRVEYLWYEYDDEYTYYTISSQKDSEIE